MDPDHDVAARTSLLAERARLRAELDEAIDAPGQMTYGSQAAAASQVFAQQRDLALRDKAEKELDARRGAPSPGSRPAPSAAASGAGDPSPRPARGAALGRLLHRLPEARRRRPMTATGPEAEPLVDDRPDPRGRPRPRGRRGPDAAGRLRPAGRPPAPEGGVAPADRCVQDPGRLRRRSPASGRRRGPAASSPTPAGNHAQGVARAARLLGIPAVIVMPSDAPAIKRERVAADGAEIVVVGTASEERRLVAERLAVEHGLSIIPPYDDDRIIAGQGTCGLEIVEDLPDIAAVLVPVGGGGLASGVAAAVRALRPEARVIGVEPELAADARESLAARPDRRVAGRAGRPDDRRRHPDPGARAADLRPPVGPPRPDRDRHRGGDRGGGPARRRGARGWSSSRRAP